MDPDLIVVGGGATGIGAARAARSRDASVLLIEQERIGGDCTFTGCMPSKAVIEAAERGASFSEAMVQARHAVARVAAAEDAVALRQEGIEVVTGVARFVSPRTIEVDGTTIKAKKGVVVATGARPVVPPIRGLDDVHYLTNETLFSLTALPASMVVLGGGPLGVEMAQAFSTLGSVVTVIEAADRLLPREEPVASAALTRVLTSGGISVRTGSVVTSVQRLDAASVGVNLADGSRVDAEELLVAVGRQPSSGGLGLERAGVATDARGLIRVDDRLRTTARGIFAAGDVAERLQFTHVGFATGRLAALNALSPVPLRRFRPATVPWVTFTSPEVARVGITEAEAAALGGYVAFLPLSEVDRAIAAGRTEGFVKIVSGPRRVLRGTAGGRILGATIVAPRAGEMLHELVLAMRSGMFPARLATTTHAYPTWSIAVQQAAAQLFGVVGGRRARPASPNPDPAEEAHRVGQRIP